MIDKRAVELLDFIDNSPTAYHAVETARNLLIKAGFIELCENTAWSIVKGGSYFVTKNDSALIAFTVGEGDVKSDGFRIIGAHTDSPCFKIKPGGAIVTEDGYLKLNTECYGGAILSTWFDRPLSIAGRVTIRGDNALSPTARLINLNRPVLVIPNLAIHFNRDINDGYKYNKQVDMLPLMGFAEPASSKTQTCSAQSDNDYILNIITDELSVEPDDILDFELFLYEYEKGNVVGLNSEFISSPRLDDLWMVYAGVRALIDSAKTAGATNIMLAMDNEEVGSVTAQGAASVFIENTLRRIYYAARYANNRDEEGFMIAIANSVMISADLAHAVHPNYADKHDKKNRPILGRGPVIKYSASQKYATTSIGSSIFISICKDNGLPFQSFANRSDMAGGSTIGPGVAAKLGLLVIDVGAPILAMHSIRELAAVTDNGLIMECFKKFYEL